MLLIKRVEDGKAHSGQVSFPGGKQDIQDADLRTTALREANEEVGLISSEVEIIGSLTPLYIPVSNFNVYPFVGYADKEPVYNLSEREVDAIIEVPVRELFLPESKTVIDITSPVLKGKLKNVKAYRLAEGHIIWGATAMIISELEAVFNTSGE